VLQGIKRVLFWTYERGSWQYDILCALILCFIFLTPRTVFDGTAFIDESNRPVPVDQEQTEEVQAAAWDSEGDSEEVQDQSVEVNRR
jgi:hypothetical protein